MKSGDNSVNLGEFTKEGEKKFSIICTDSQGRNSHQLFNYFLVRNNFTYNNYQVTTKDLKKYKIDNTNNPKNGLKTVKGLQKILDKKKSEGYNKLTLLPGTYCVDYRKTINIPTEFTLDLNDSTIKLNGFTGDSATMISLNNTYDSHLIHGTIEGDYYEHNYKKSPNNSEWVNGVSIVGESKYSSLENLTIKNITGYGATNGIGKSPDNKLDYTYISPIAVENFKLGDINRKNGKKIDSKTRTTSEFVNIKDYANIDYLTVSRYLGYQGNSCSTWNLICHFYDSDKNFIKSIDAYQYRKVEIPKGAKYMKVTILSKDTPTDLSVQLFRVPTHCTIKNVKFENCRCVGLAPAAMKDMLIENCEFINCGQTSAKCALDAEDGWDMMQDVTFRKLNFRDNPNNDFLTCAGQNFTIEDMIAGNIYLWDRTNSYTLRNCNNINSAVLRSSNRTKSGYNRIYNNKVKEGISLTIDEENHDNWNMAVKDTIINGKSEGLRGSGNFIRCEISNTSLSNGNFINCTFNNISKENTGGAYYNCKFNKVTGNMHGTFEFYNCEINNWNCNGGSYNPTYIIENSALNNFQIQLGYWHQGAKMSIKNSTIINDDYLLKLPHYAMKKNITLENNHIFSNSSEGLVVFYDDRTGNQAGRLVKQKKLTLKKNDIDLPNSDYIVTGLDDSTLNNINIRDFYNKYDKLKLCDLRVRKNKHISISSK
ncbi:MAG: hypothetical protein RSC84_04305 [Peptostreptococcaceae bacterium]